VKRTWKMVCESSHQDLLVLLLGDPGVRDLQKNTTMAKMLSLEPLSFAVSTSVRAAWSLR